MLPESALYQTDGFERNAKEYEQALDIADRIGRLVAVTAIDRHPCITIDGPTTNPANWHSKDRDDGLWIEKTDEDRFEVSVFTADIGGLIEPDSPLDIEARRRKETRYFKVIEDQEATLITGHNRPLLPWMLSEGALSMIAGSVVPSIRLKLSVVLDKGQYRVEQEQVEMVLAEVIQNLTYESANQKINQGPRSELAALATIMQNIGAARKSERAKTLQGLKGALPNELQGEIDKYEAPQGPAEDLVKELMLLANVRLSDYLFKNQCAAIWRNQLIRVINEGERNQVVRFKNLKDVPEDASYPKACRLTFDSCYSVANEGHVSLAVPRYAQFTSGGRRWTDLANQRQLNRLLTKEGPLKKAELKSALQSRGR